LPARQSGMRGAAAAPRGGRLPQRGDGSVVQQHRARAFDAAGGAQDVQSASGLLGGAKRAVARSFTCHTAD